MDQREQRGERSDSIVSIIVGDPESSGESRQDQSRLRRSLSCVGFFHVEASVSTVFPLAATVLELVDPNRLRRYKRGKKIAVCLIVLASVSCEDSASSGDSNSRAPVTASNTIQKLRKILEKFGEEQQRGLKRVFLSNRSITCNDGSQAGFYLRKSHGSKKWIVFLEGGWCCFDQKTCRHRWIKLRNYMTSTNWSETRDVGGILSSNPQENPYWWNVNHVYVPYCTSDSWSGTRSFPNEMFSFMGAEIVSQVIRDLVPLGLDTASSLMLAGSSAGGMGVMLNLDRVQNLIHHELGLTNTVVRGVSDSGWFLDQEPYPPSGGLLPGETVKMGMELWRARMPTNCVAQYPKEPWKCFFGYKLYPTLSTPLFIFQWLFDKAQMKFNNVGTPLSKEQWDYIHRMGRIVRQTLDNVTAVFAPSCISHNVLTAREWQQVKINQVTVPQAFSSSSTHVETNQTCTRPITNPSLRTNETKKNTTLATSAVSGNNDNERKDDDTGVNIKQNINVLGRKNRVKGTMSHNNNGSIDGRGNKKRKRRRKHKDNKRQRERNRNGKNRERKEKRQRRKEERKKNNNKYISGNNHRTMLNDTRPQRSLLPSGNKKEIKCVAHNCHHRHTDNCSWPQCNHSCPKLHNPFTGEEMDFIELLKSFGLDMKSVAIALGIDIHTLNNMNHAELLNLLTQQSN
ncbi:hypothetical protein G9C98_003507 [Cotesia typhae]|uniref:Palmitoleoyl-protein carboxylesterase NOTUM n=1 Tax=Cotesia typhae TaxID=2053667 RepID=A0A8J5QQB7_9HYME|nr:hypothetical protein G9C98_003507 [Cotesia typhae]